MKRPENYRDLGDWADWEKIPETDATLPALLAYWQRQAPDDEFLVYDDGRATYREVSERSARLARQLVAAGVGKGTRVGLMMPNSVAFVVTWLAILRSGAAAVTISTLSTAEEIRKIVRHSDIQHLFASDRYLHHDYIARLSEAFAGLAASRAPHRLAEAPYLRELWIWSAKVPAWAQRVDLDAPCDIGPDLLAAIEAQISPADVACIVYTSGSTAEPKGVIHTHGAFMRQSRKLAAVHPYQRDERVFSTSPLFWVGGLTYTLLHAMQVGATILGSTKTGPALLDLIENERVTYFTGWPHLARALAADPSFATRNFSQLRGGTLDEALPAEKRSKDGHWYGNSLGMTESCGPHSIYRREHPAEFQGSFGAVMPGMEHRIVDPDSGAVLPEGDQGELQVRGDALTVGLVKRERADVFTADGWYGTGDLCSIRKGYLFFHGRIDDMIKASGANVSPREVEAVLASIPGVAQAMVTGVTDRQRWNVVGALIVPKPGAALDEKFVRSEAAKRLSSYKVPRVVIVMEAAKLPLLSSTKIDRRRLVAMLAAEAARAPSP
jgi:acyl-CoA synthetase (AMP-forming)/AMP-acid ligase II